MPRFTASLVGVISAAIIAGPAAVAAQAGMVVQQRTTFSIAKITSGDLQQTISILGADRAKTVTTGKAKVLIVSVDASGTEITRLDQDQVIRLNDKKQTYTIKTLAETRAELAKQQKDAEKSATEARETDDTRYDAVVNEARRTGEKQVINGFATEQVLIKITVFAENTKTNEKTVAYHITADSWFDPGQGEAARLNAAFRVAQMQALGVDPAVAANPYARWLTNVDVETSRIKGYPIRSTIIFEAAAVPGAADGQKDDQPPTGVAGAIGGMFGKKKSAPAASSPNGGSVLFTATTEVSAISVKAPAASEFEIPAGYVRK